MEPARTLLAGKLLLKVKYNKPMDIKELTKKIVRVSDQYAKACKINRDDDWYILKLQEELGELIQSYLSFTGRGRDRGKSKEEALKQKWFKYL